MTVAAAEARLLAVTESVDDAVQAAWEANLDAVQAVKVALIEAVRAQVTVEVECGNAARARNPIAPVFSVDELTAAIRPPRSQRQPARRSLRPRRRSRLA